MFELSHVDPARDLLVAVAPDGTIVAMGWAMLHLCRMPSSTRTCRAPCTPTGVGGGSAPCSSDGCTPARVR